MMKRLQSAYASAQAVSSPDRHHKASATPRSRISGVDLEKELRAQMALRKIILHQAVLESNARSRHEQMQRDRAMTRDNFGCTSNRPQNPESCGWFLPESCMRPMGFKSTMPESPSACSGVASTASYVSDSESDTPRGFVSQHDFVVAKQPANGSCLFHALTYGLGGSKTARELRREVCKFLLRNSTLELSGLPLKEWVKLETGKSLERYVSSLARGAWGGAIELEIFSRLYPVDVAVFVRCAGGYKKTCHFGDEIKTAKTVMVLYEDGQHYDALLPAPTKSTTGVAFSSL